MAGERVKPLDSSLPDLIRLFSEEGMRLQSRSGFPANAERAGSRSLNEMCE